MVGMFEGTGLTELYIDQDPQDLLKNKMGNFDESNLQKSYNWEQAKDDETVTVAVISRQIESKLKVQTNIEYPQGLNIAPAKDPSIGSGINQEAAEDYDASLLGGGSLALDPAGDNISILGDESSLTCGDV